MTTIAYHKESNALSCDSQVTVSDVKGLSENKIKIGVDYIYSGFGAPCDVDHLVECYMDGMPVEKELNAYAILIEKETRKATLISFNSKSMLICATYIDCNHAIGTGREFALGAMGFGACSLEAVEVAIEHDIYSGGEVHTFDIDNWEFI